MDSPLFSLEPEPATEARHQRARRLVVRQIQAEHADRDKLTSQEKDNAAFRRRAWLVMSGETLVDAIDPRDGVTLDLVLEEMSKDASRDVSVWRDGRLVAVVAGGKVATRFDRSRSPSDKAEGRSSAPDEQPTTPLPIWIDPSEAVEIVGGYEILDAMTERVDLSVRVFYLRSEIVSLAHQPTRTRLSRAHGGTNARKA